MSVKTIDELRRSVQADIQHHVDTYADTMQTLAARAINTEKLLLELLNAVEKRDGVHVLNGVDAGAIAEQFIALRERFPLPGENGQ
jgi:hypothetical protein